MLKSPFLVFVRWKSLPNFSLKKKGWKSTAILLRLMNKMLGDFDEVICLIHMGILDFGLQCLYIEEVIISGLVST